MPLAGGAAACWRLLSDSVPEDIEEESELLLSVVASSSLLDEVVVGSSGGDCRVGADIVVSL